MTHLLFCLLSFTWLIPLITCINITNFPFCAICECNTFNYNNNNNNSSNDMDVGVYCKRNIKQYLFDIKYWFNNETNSTYNYKQIIINNNGIINLDKQFPKSNLQLLDLSKNSIYNISDNIFSYLQNMEILILSENNIEILHPDAFNGLYLEGDFMPLKSLKILKLDHNQLHSLDGNLFEHTSRIEDLSLSYNPLKKLDQQTIIAITSLVYLKNLNLSYTELTQLPDYFMHTPKFIKILDLSGNNFSMIPKTLGDAHSLEVLYIDNNPIKILTAENGFPVVSTLKILHMCHMPLLTNLSGQSLSNLENLEELYLTNNNELIYIDRNVLSAKRNGSQYETWPPIKKLHLENNKLSSIDMHLILTWDVLIELDLTNNAWTCECENQWMVDELLPIYLHINEFSAKSMRCAAPIEMVEFTFYDIYEKKSIMRCLDYYGNRPENDGILLIGILTGILITIPLILFIIYAYQRHWFGIFDKSPAAFSRQFYQRTLSKDEYF